MSKKEKLLRLVQDCNDEQLIEEAIDMFEKPNEDWWDELSAEEQKELLESEDEPAISHEQFMKEVAAWKKK